MSTSYYVCLFYGIKIDMSSDKLRELRVSLYSNDPEVKIVNMNPILDSNDLFIAIKHSILSKNEYEDNNQDVVVLNDFNSELWDIHLLLACKHNNIAYTKPSWHLGSYYS